MSSSERARVLAALALSLRAAGCFQPIYGEAAHPGLVQAMRAIEVDADPRPHRPLSRRRSHQPHERLRPDAAAKIPAQRKTVAEHDDADHRIADPDRRRRDGHRHRLFALTKIERRQDPLRRRGDQLGGLRPHAAELRRPARRRATPRFASPNRSPTRSSCGSRASFPRRTDRRPTDAAPVHRAGASR